MIKLRPTKENELRFLDEMDRQAHARDFVLQTGIEAHQNNFRDPKIIYLSIENGSAEFCGYFLLAYEPDTKSVEFRRILIDQTQRGIGQTAITEMENYCRNKFDVKRIWLDVFEGNDIGIHIYEKIGYVRFKEEKLEGRKLYFYEKTL